MANFDAFAAFEKQATSRPQTAKDFREEELDMITGKWDEVVPEREKTEVTTNKGLNPKPKPNPKVKLPQVESKKRLRNYNLTDEAVENLMEGALAMGCFRKGAGGQEFPNLSKFIQCMADERIWEHIK